MDGANLKQRQKLEYNFMDPKELFLYHVQLFQGLDNGQIIGWVIIIPPGKT
jgi:hypothetical protein